MAGDVTRGAVTGACRDRYALAWSHPEITTMRHTPWILSLLLAASPAVLAQQPPAAVAPSTAWSPRTGDAWVDATLADINAYGGRYPGAFADELARYHAAPRDVVSALLAAPGWTPGDVYYACALAEAIGRSCRYVADERQAHPGEGWGALAQRLGVKPGSPQFHQLKDGFAGAYGRWGRPLPAAATGKGAGHGKAHGHGKDKGRKK
jgi:hypothetical protein